MSRSLLSKNKTSPQYILPSNNKELLNFSQNFKLDMMEQVVSSIEFALENNLPFVEVFQFKNSDFVITLSEKDYLTNMENVYSYYMEKEKYEYCARVVKLKEILNKKCFIINNNDTNEKQTYKK